MPHAILFDLDDTLISAYRDPHRAWSAVVGEFSEEIPAHIGGGQTGDDLVHSLLGFSTEFWSDAERHRIWRLRDEEARYQVVKGGLEHLNKGAFPIDEGFATRLANRFGDYRTENMHLFEGAHDVLDTLKDRGIPLGLITNGCGKTQRGKIERFDLTHRFEHIQIEGEMGFGKPEDRAYYHAAKSLGSAPDKCWIIGDNLEWEVNAPAKLGFKTIWHDNAGSGLPAGHVADPHHIITALSQVIDVIDRQ